MAEAINTDIIQEPEDQALVNGVLFTEQATLALYGDQGPAIWAKALAEKKALAARDAVRQAIIKNVGDSDSILGTTADVTQLNAAAILAFIIAIKSNTTYAAFRTQFTQTIEALVPADGGDDVYTQAANFLSGIQNGEVILTAALKGFPEVLAEMGARSTGVAQVLISAQSKGK